MGRAAKACDQAHCPHLQPCPTHLKIAWAGSTRKTRLPRDWRRRRRTVLARDITCQQCNNALATEVDHIQPGDNHDLTNLQGLCTNCHRDKTQREATAARGAQ